MLLLRYPSIVDAAWVNCPKDAARHLTNPFLPGTPIARIESWQEHNRDRSEEFPLEESRLSVILAEAGNPARSFGAASSRLVMVAFLPATGNELNAAGAAQRPTIKLDERELKHRQAMSIAFRKSNTLS